jgi:hypothetical protein
MGLMLFPDLLQRLLPFHWKFWDRSRGLEEVWARDWMLTISACGSRDAREGNPWEHPFASLHLNRAPMRWLPNLELNSTALNAGMPVVQSDFILGREDDFDLLGGDFAAQTITLAQSVHDSARFPYASPAGVYSTRGGRAVNAHVELLKLIGGCTEQFAELLLPKATDKSTEPSMDWMLSKHSRTQMDGCHRSEGVTSTPLAEHLDRVHTWLVRSPAQ